MNRMLKRFHKEGSGVRLLDSERNAIREFVLRNPLPQERRLPLFILKIGLATAAGLFIVLVPLTYAAQQSIPGDLLHGLEIYIIEEVEEAMRFSPEANTAYHAERLEERLRETQMATDDELESADQAAEITENLEEHVHEILSVPDDKIARRGRLNHLVKTSALLDAEGEILENTDIKADVIEELGDLIDAELSREIEDYVSSESPDRVIQTLSEEVVETQTLIESPVLTKETALGAIDQLADATEKIKKDSQLDEALKIVLQTQIEILSENYLIAPEGK